MKNADFNLWFPGHPLRVRSRSIIVSLVSFFFFLHQGLALQCIIPVTLRWSVKRTKISLSTMFFATGQRDMKKGTLAGDLVVERQKKGVSCLTDNLNAKIKTRPRIHCLSGNRNYKTKKISFWFLMARHAEIIKNFRQSHLILSNFSLSGFY